MSASMCASAASLLTPDTPCRSRYRDACSGLAGYTVYPLPDGATDLDHFRVRRRDRAGGVIHEYRLVA